jgi:hypothetical protein
MFVKKKVWLMSPIENLWPTGDVPSKWLQDCKGVI